MAAAQELAVDEAKIKRAVRSGTPLAITTYTLPHELELYIDQAIAVFLRQAGKESLKGYVAYCVRELTANAKKANAKRVSFSERGLYVKLILQAKSNTITVEVRNNAVATATEMARVRDRLDLSRRCDSLGDALAQPLDETEGAGLGLLMVVLTLRKIGLGEDSFDVKTTATETIARIRIPMDTAFAEPKDG
jgi:hypothetical protein